MKLFMFQTWRTTGPIRRAKGGWTPQEDDTLRTAVAYFKGRVGRK
ncbi:hypothetical protein CK203_033649 [Vitis vinifera]|uniref:Uncharacterized protein n=1 Tax=Vitis vinifera TaxID=29760 RepID=A0A438HSL5_VITVI|nr:hypothetical protein CK203_033649 [Vitis vinifera]